MYYVLIFSMFFLYFGAPFLFVDNGDKINDLRLLTDQNTEISSNQCNCQCGWICGCACFVTGVILLGVSLLLQKRCNIHTGNHNLGNNGDEPTQLTEFPIESPSFPNVQQTREITEIPRWKLQLQNTLGEGAFGRVIRAKAIDLSCQYVAVKILKVGHLENDLAVFMQEIDIMKDIGEHVNVISMLGYCTHNGPLYMVMELADKGNLRDYLRLHDSNKELKRHYSFIENDTDTSNQDMYDTLLTHKDLIGFAIQITHGLTFLESKKCVHRDLAARNILVTKDNNLKIADFGLARKLTSFDHYYRKQTVSRLPVKWMAPESLLHSIYSLQSDVWSFGILLWEIESLGETPYPTIDVENLATILMEGHRMKQPPNCPLQVYILMRDCWQYKPTNRPRFQRILEKLDFILQNEYFEIGPEFAITTVTPRSGIN